MNAPIQLLRPVTSKKQAEAIAGTLSKPSKMPGHGYGLSAERCVTGSQLAKIPGTVCYDCYALKGRYAFTVVKGAHQVRHGALFHPQWVDAMVYLIRHTGDLHFRWHDSGDLQGTWHLENICEIARRLPGVSFWLPTREKGFVRDHQRQGFQVPPNLTIRVSGTMVDGPPPAGFANTSTVVSSGATCPAPLQGNSCAACRACWDPSVGNVSYHQH